MTDQPGADTEQATQQQSEEPSSDQADGMSVPEESALSETDVGEWRRQQAQIIYNFNGQTNAHGSHFGHLASSSVRRVTGRLPPEELVTALRHFVPTTSMSAAVTTLTEHHLVVLNGAEGSGRRTGALAVLREVIGDSQPVSVLPPSHTIAELVDVNNARYQVGRGYLVQDWISEGAAGSLWQFDMDQLRRKLTEIGAYLVVTGSLDARDRHVEGLVVDWARPDSVAVFDARLPASKVTLDPTELKRVYDRVGKLQHPRDVVAVVELIADGVDTALEALGDVERSRVTRWFDDKPSTREVFSITVLAFLYGIPELEFQGMLARLVELYEAPTDDITRPANSIADRLPQYPSNEADEQTLDVVRSLSGDADGLGDRRRVFKSVHYREQVFTELTVRYGFELWAPLCQWIAEAARMPSPEARLQLALGVALMCQHAPDQVEQFLGQWADGLAAERLTAAYVLSWMCGDDLLAATALRIAVRWTDNAGTRRAATSAMAFGGQLGIRYQSKALSCLWHLALRGEPASTRARESMALLLCAAVVDPASATTVLRFLCSALRQLLAGGVESQAHGRHHLRVRKALSAVLTVLSARPDGSAAPMAAVILRTLPARTQRLGELWAEVLRSAPHRGEAIDALRDTLDALTGDGNSRDAVRALGAAVRTHLSDEECRLLHVDLATALAEHGTAASSRPLVAALLEALRGTQQ
ncbi:MAG: hypothetical protein ACRDQ4_06610 [Pseudonocardiaceae bacterium]